MAGENSNRPTATTLADGRFTLPDVPADAQFALLLGDPTISDDFVITRNEPLEAAAIVLPFDFDLPAGIVRVQVVDAATQAPLAGVRVSARPTNRNAQADRFPGYRYRAGWAVQSAADGAATLRCLPEGEPIRLDLGGGNHATTTIGMPAAAIDDQGPVLVVPIAKK